MTPYFERDGVTIYHGDCREILPALDPVDVVLTDPPYSDRTHEGARSGNTKGGTVRAGSQSLGIDFDPTTPEGLRTVFAMCAPKRWLISFIDYHMVPDLEDAPPKGIRGVRMGIWVKPNSAPQFTGDRPGQGWEAIWIAHRTEAGRMRWNGGGHHAVWTHSVERGEHPTTKPLPLVRTLTSLFTEDGETVLDPFMGSGTTLVAARDMGRRAIGIELEERYCEIAAKRLAQGLLFGGGA